MNFFDAQLIRDGEKYYVELEGWRVPLSEKKCGRLLQNDVPGRPVTLGVRPEHTLLWQEGGVEAHVDVFHGNIHGFDTMRWTRNAKEARKKLILAVEKFLK